MRQTDRHTEAALKRNTGAAQFFYCSAANAEGECNECKMHLKQNKCKGQKGDREKKGDVFTLRFIHYLCSPLSLFAA